jgi:hypothetical protein
VAERILPQPSQLVYWPTTTTRACEIMTISCESAL